jgi:hypothetical protein
MPLDARLAARFTLSLFLGATALSAHVRAQGVQLPPNVGNFQGFTGAPTVGGVAPPSPFRGPQRPPPAALPGAQSSAGAAPPVQTPMLLSPTDALFDAIDRGDIAAARDAIGRGADLNGRNVLGMTPVQLSIDLSRNDITFLLLANGAAQAPGAPSATAGSTGAAALLTGKGAKVAKATHRPPRSVQTVAAPPPPQMPRLFAGNGGAPNPSAGFLGFDPGR